MEALAVVPVQQRTSLYVGDLDPEVTEADLKNAFHHMGPIASFRLCRCAVTGKSLCYGYVNFYSHSQAIKALEHLNHTPIKGKPMRIMWSQRDPLTRKSGLANLFVKNLDASITSACLQRVFSQYGTILSCKVAEDNGQSKGFGFVQFDCEESAVKAQIALHDTVLQGKKLYVSKFVKRCKGNAAASHYEEANFTNLYVKNLTENMTDDDLKDMFSTYGKVSSAVVMKDSNGKSKGFGFVNFESPENAKKAIDGLNGSLAGSKTLYVGRAQKKDERKEILRCEYKERFNSHTEKLGASNLYVKNLSLLADDKKLKELFRAFGEIVSAKVMRHDNGESKQFGFVCFSCPEEARNAMNTMNGTIFEGKRLYVAIARRKKDRILELQNQFTQHPSESFYLSNSYAVPPPVNPFYFNLAPYPSSFPFLRYPLSYQTYSADSGIQLQHPFAMQTYQQSLSSYIPWRQSHLENNGNTGNGFYQQQVIRYATSNDHNQNQNQAYAWRQKVGSRKGSRRRGATEITSRISDGSEESSMNSKQEIGNHLHGLVKNIQPERAGKIPGMLLEMTNSDISKLLNSPNSLASQVDRAVQVLKEANGGGSAVRKSARCLRY